MDGLSFNIVFSTFSIFSELDDVSAFSSKGLVCYSFIIYSWRDYGCNWWICYKDIKKSKYELEESTGENLTVSESDDKNNPEQKPVTVDAATGEEVYEPAPPPKPTVEVKRLQTQLDSTLQRMEQLTLSSLYLWQLP